MSRACAPLFRYLALLALGALPAGCGRTARPHTSVSLDLDSGVAEQRYLAPPQATEASATREGGFTVVGLAEPVGRVVLSTPEGGRYIVPTDRQGRWTSRLPAAATPRLYALSSRVGGRMVHAQGALVTAPRSRCAAVLVRAGYPTLPLCRGDGGVAVVSLDYDPGGFVGVSGLAAPKARVRLSIDGSAAGVTQADAQGRFALLAANRRLGAGAHEVEAETSAGAARTSFHLAAAMPLSAPYAAEEASGGWRVEWALNGGGVQTTLLATGG